MQDNHSKILIVPLHCLHHHHSKCQDDNLVHKFSWPMEKLNAPHVVVIAGGLGLAPVRPVVQHLVAEKTRAQNATLLIGVRHPEELLYQKEIETWREQGLNIEITVESVEGMEDGQNIWISKEEGDDGEVIIIEEETIEEKDENGKTIKKTIKKKKKIVKKDKKY